MNGDDVSTEVLWFEQPWGEMGVARLDSAPFPDDSRRNGYKTSKESFSYDGHYDDNSVVFVIPKGFKAGNRVDLILFFHGHRNEAQKSVGKYKLGEQLEASGRNAILILPQGPKDAPDEGIGKLEKPNGLANLINEVMLTLQHESRIPKGSKVGNIILTGHSGGYNAIGLCLAVGGMKDQVKEAWLFDAAYGVLAEISAPFASPKSQLRLRSIFTDHLAARNARIMSNINLRGGRAFLVEDDSVTTEGTTSDQLAAMKFHSGEARAESDEISALLRRERTLFIHTTLTHEQVPFGKKYFEKFAKESPFLQARGSASDKSRTATHGSTMEQ